MGTVPSRKVLMDRANEESVGGDAVHWESFHEKRAREGESHVVSSSAGSLCGNDALGEIGCESGPPEDRQ